MKTLHQALLETHAAANLHITGEAPDWFDPAMGICYHVAKVMEDEDLFSGSRVDINDLINVWPELNGFSRAWPVGGMSEFWGDDLWSNPRRWALLEWLIEETR